MGDVDEMKRRHPAAVLLGLLLLTTVGCTAVRAEDPDRASPSIPPTPAPTSTQTLMPNTLEARYAFDEPLLGSVSSARGADAFRTGRVGTGRVAVYIRCVGEGSVVVDVEDTVTFTQPCVHSGEDARGTRNAVELYGTGPHTIAGSAGPKAIWAVAVTEIPPR